uniref:Uncharacterized protein n=1 Tax=Arion vulgaris TaxID=1028688 RepID=A0A0B7A683_9EUPU
MFYHEQTDNTNNEFKLKKLINSNSSVSQELCTNTNFMESDKEKKHCKHK